MAKIENEETKCVELNMVCGIGVSMCVCLVFHGAKQTKTCGIVGYDLHVLLDRHIMANRKSSTVHFI